MNHTLLELPSIDAMTVDLSNQLFGVSRRLEIMLAGESCKLTLAPLSACRVQPAFQIKIGQREATALLSLDDWNKVAGALEILDGESLCDLPERIASIIVESLLSDLLDQASQWFGDQCEVVGYADAQLVEQASSGIEFIVTCPERPSIRGQLIADADVLHPISQLVAACPQDPSSSPMNVVCESSLEIGETRLGLTEMRRLRVHDVVLFDRFSDSSDVGRLRIGTGTVLGSLASQQFHVTGHSHPAAEREGSPLNVSVCRGRIRLTVEDLESLAVGSSLAVEEDSEFRLNLGKQTIAHGELIQLGCRVGFRIRGFDARCSQTLANVDGSDLSAVIDP